MIAFLRRRRLQILASVSGFLSISSRIQLDTWQTSLLLSSRSLSTSFNVELESLKPEEDKQKRYSSYAVSYLVHSCGFSPESANSVAKKIKIRTPDRVDAVVSLFREYGFTNAQISKVIRKHPRILLSDPSNTLLPKLEFLCSIGISRLDLGRMVSWNSGLMSRSLEHNLIPCYNIFKDVLVSDDKVVMAFKLSSGIVMGRLHKNLYVNLSILREVGMPESVISSLVTYQPGIVCMTSAKFRDFVNKAIEIGFNPLKSTFVHALRLVYHTSNTVWEQKMEVYRSWGLSEDEIWSAIRKFPLCMIYSTKNIMSTIDFLVNKMGWLPADVASIPIVIGFSLKKRIVPRCSVVRVLLLKGLVKEDIRLVSVLISTEKWFLNTFVIKYQEEVPQLLSIFRGEMNIMELGFGFEEKPSLSPLT